jgi:TrwC relaxase
MTMSIARLSAQSGLKYLFKTTMMDDLTVAPVDATSYYLKAGTPTGRWIGSGLPGIGRAAGDAVTETDAKAIFEYAVHPDTAAPLGRPHSKPTVVQTAQGRAETRHAVVGFDLTFSVPRSCKPTTPPSKPPCSGSRIPSSTPVPDAAASPTSAPEVQSPLPSTIGNHVPGIHSFTPT